MSNIHVSPYILIGKQYPLILASFWHFSAHFSPVLARFRPENTHF